MFSNRNAYLFGRQTEKDKQLKLADCHLRLGEVGLETGEQETSWMHDVWIL